MYYPFPPRKGVLGQAYSERERAQSKIGWGGFWLGRGPSSPMVPSLACLNLSGQQNRTKTELKLRRFNENPEMYGVISHIQ